MILITGSAGYIGSHVANELDECYNVLGIDNFSRGSETNKRCETLTCDIRQKEQLIQVFEKNKIDLVLHLAALTSVPESMKRKNDYIETNIDGTKNLIDVMKDYGCNNLIFSSTASLYQQSQEPLKEIDVLQPLNNYARTKFIAEQYIKEQDWLNSIIFRYFNVIGYADWYDKSKESCKTNVVPALANCVKEGKTFNIYGNCYPVKRKCILDKTCVRDYIDVRDIARAHVLAIDYLELNKGSQIFNLGTKLGTSVYELYETFKRVNNVELNAVVLGPRKGDSASAIADSTKARELLHWRPRYSLEESLLMKL